MTKDFTLEDLQNRLRSSFPGCFSPIEEEEEERKKEGREEEAPGSPITEEDVLFWRECDRETETRDPSPWVYAENAQEAIRLFQEEKVRLEEK